VIHLIGFSKSGFRAAFLIAMCRDGVAPAHVSAEVSDHTQRSDQMQKPEELATLRLQGSVRADNRLLLVCDLLLDEDIQPAAEDFAIVQGEEGYRVVAVQLESPWTERPSCAALVLVTDQPLPKSASLTVSYRPTQWMMWSLLHDKSVASFEWVVQADKSLGRTAVPEILQPSSVEQEPTVGRVAVLSERIGQAVNPPAVDALAQLKAPVDVAKSAAGKSLFDRMLAVSVLLAVTVGGFLVVMLFYIGLQIFGGHTFESTKSAKPRVASMCTLSLADGSRYEGQCIDGVADGQGVHIAVDGSRYVGGWYDQHPHGQGMLTMADGRTLSGTWRNGLAVGEFTLRWSNGSQYVGTLENDEPHGEGTMTFANGDVYKGGFSHNIKQGEGTMIWISGVRYEGGYKNDQPNGFGVFTAADGSRFEGMFIAGQMTQNGICYFADGRSRRGSCP